MEFNLYYRVMPDGTLMPEDISFPVGMPEDISFPIIVSLPPYDSKHLFGHDYVLWLTKSKNSQVYKVIFY